MKFIPLAAAALATSFALASDPALRPVDYLVAGFEDATKDATVIDSELWTGDSDSAIVREYAEAPSLQSYPAPFENAGLQFLEIDASSEVKVNPGAQGGITYIDSMVKFSAAEEDPSASITDAMFLLWLQKNGSSYDIKVKGALADYNDGILFPGQTYTITDSDVSIEPGSWHRVKVTFYPQLLGDGVDDQFAAFTVQIDGEDMAATEATYTEAASVNYINGDTIATNYVSLFQANRMIPATNPAAAITSIGFQGNGAIDDFVVSADAPLPTSVVLDWTSSEFSDVAYVIGDVTNNLDVTAGTATINCPNGSAITLVGTTTAGCTVAATGDTTTPPALTTADISWYFPQTATAGQDGTAEHPFEIADAGDLKALQAAVANVAAARSFCYVQVANIALDIAWPGIGIQNGKDLATSKTEEEVEAFDNGAFRGTYDGGNYTISNFQMIDGLDYCGLFNSVKNATIKNLKVSYKDGTFAKDMVAANEACGATFVGVAKVSSLQNLTSLSGTVSCTKGFGGIVGYLMAGSTVDSCTNNVNLTSTASNKAGGIAMIAQNGTGTAVIRNCKNNGTTTGNAKQKGGIVGYIGTDITIADCENTAGSEPSFFSYNKGTVTVTGVNKASASVLPCKTTDGAVKAVNGLSFATVAGDVATFVADNALAAGNTYKVMASGATATATLATAGDSISFDEALATPTYSITAAAGLVVSSNKVGDVRTFTTAPAKATVITIADAGATTNTVGTYSTLAAAVAAAEDGSTVLLLGNVTLTERVEPNLGANTTLTIDLGGYTITREGTSGNGSVFDVKSGDVTIQNGVIDCTQDDTAIAADGVYAITSRSGSNVTLAALAITVDSECGACAYPFPGSTMTIESGTYANVTTTPYRWNTAITGMAVNQPNNATQNLFIKGGSFSQYDPQLGDDSGAMTDFTDDGFVAIDDGNGHFVVQTGYNVTFDANGGTPAPEAQRVAAGNLVTAPASAPTKAGDDTVVYVFNAWQLDNADYDFTVAPSADITLVATYTATSLAATTWIGGASGDWANAANWDIGSVPTKATVVTFTNDAQIAISNTDACKEMVLDNANVALVQDANATQPILRFYGDGDSAVSVASGATGSLSVNGLALFNERTDSASLKIGCGLEILGNITFRGVNPGNNISASFTITGKTTVSANALVKTIDHGTTQFQGGIEVAKGVTAKIVTNPNGGATIGTGVTLVANDGAGSPTAIWLMKVASKATLLDGVSVSVDADHDAAYYVKKRSDTETGTYGGACDVYEALPKPTVTVTATGVTVTGVTDGQKVVPGTALTIGANVAEGYEPSVTITKTADSTVLLTTNAVSFAYTMPEFDIAVAATATAVVTDESFSDGTTDNAFSIPATTVADLKELCGVADLAATVEGQGITYAQAYALGLIDETTGAVAELPAITIEFENGQPVVKMDGTATDGYTVTCHLYARDSLTVDWGEQPIADGAYGDDIADPDTSLPAARFYKVKVTIANDQ